MRLFGKWINKITGNNNVEKDIINAFNKTMYEFIGGQDADYDHNRRTYIEKGFGLNPDVYAVITQQADKINSIPYHVKKVVDKKSRSELKQLENVTKGNYSVPQLKRKARLETKAFDDEYLPFPLEQPNPNQTWSEIWALSKVFEQTTGNYYLYKVCPQDGVNKGIPNQVYILPSHLMKIVIKEDADILDEENVIDHYMLTEGNQWISFDTNDIIHVKLPNPFFDFQGSHLYGLSPLRVLLKNIESSNDALSQNVKTMKNGGVFGFIHSKDSDNTMTAEQATQLKEKMKEMDRNPARLSHIAGASIPLAFTKISLTTDELKPFDFLAFDQRMICNVLGWDTLLLNNKEASTYDNFKTAQQTVILNHIVPRLKLLEDALNKEFIPLFKGYEDAEVFWDISDLPEMAVDLKALLEGYANVGLTENEKREMAGFEKLEMDGMDIPHVSANLRRIDETGLSDFEIDRAFKE